MHTTTTHDDKQRKTQFESNRLDTYYKDGKLKQGRDIKPTQA